MAVFYKYQYTNKRKNIHPCLSHLNFFIKWTQFFIKSTKIGVFFIKWTQFFLGMDIPR